MLQYLICIAYLISYEIYCITAGVLRESQHSALPICLLTLSSCNKSCGALDTVHQLVLGECRTLWGKHEQATCILATEERTLYQNVLSVSEITTAVGSLWRHIFGTDHVRISFQPFLPGLIDGSLGLSSACLIPSQGHSP